jgi:small subunit ribosomal protein S1
MSDLTFEQMLEDSFKTIRNGEVVDGVVIDVKPDEIILNIGYKSDGILTRSEYTNESNVDLTQVVSVGDEMTVKVLKVNDGEGQLLLTYKRLIQEKGNEKLREAYENHEVLKAPVVQILGVGICVVVDEARVFIPSSLVSDTYEKDLSKYKDQEIEFVISEFNPKRNRIIGDRRQLLAAERAEKQKELLGRLKVGDRVVGIVKNVTNFGVFIDLGGIDGLLHISEMAWGRIDDPRKELKAGEEVEVLVKDINNTKIALTLKFPETNPWVKAAEEFKIGKEVTGKVARMTDFGAFIELSPGVDALLHVSQISKTHVNKPSDVLSVGQEITARIVDFIEADRKISLSMRVLETADEAKETAEEAKEAVEEAKEEVKEEVKEAVEEVKEEAKETVEEAKERTKETAEEAKEEVKEAVEETTEDAKEANDDTTKDDTETASDAE